MAWRDYWQQVWIAKKEDIKIDLKNKQTPISNYQIPIAVVNAETGIEAVDIAIKQLYETGYMHIICECMWLPFAVILQTAIGLNLPNGCIAIYLMVT